MVTPIPHGIRLINGQKIDQTERKCHGNHSRGAVVLVRPLFVVLEASGTGKSSFLRAGLLPRLRREDRNFFLQ